MSDLQDTRHERICALRERYEALRDDPAALRSGEAAQVYSQLRCLERAEEFDARWANVDWGEQNPTTAQAAAARNLASFHCGQARMCARVRGDGLEDPNGEYMEVRVTAGGAYFGNWLYYVKNDGEVR